MRAHVRNFSWQAHAIAGGSEAAHVPESEHVSEQKKNESLPVSRTYMLLIMFIGFYLVTTLQRTCVHINA